MNETWQAFSPAGQHEASLTGDDDFLSRMFGAGGRPLAGLWPTVAEMESGEGRAGKIGSSTISRARTLLPPLKTKFQGPSRAGRTGPLCFGPAISVSEGERKKEGRPDRKKDPRGSRKEKRKRRRKETEEDAKKKRTKRNEDKSAEPREHLEKSSEVPIYFSDFVSRGRIHGPSSARQTDGRTGDRKRPLDFAKPRQARRGRWAVRFSP